MRIKLLFPIFLIILTLGACTPRMIPAPQPTQVQPTLEASPSVPTPASEEERIASLAVADLSTRLILDRKLVSVLSVEPTLWEDASLGCPRPGEVYTQQTVPGYRLRLEANGVEYVYHTDTANTVILCAEEDLPPFPLTPGEIDDGEPWMPAD